jgi:hypothetical protein
MDRWRLLRAHTLASGFGLLLLVMVIAVVLLNVLMITGATNCASEAPGFRCAIAKFIAG